MGRPKTSLDVSLTCLVCGKNFTVPDYVARKTSPKFCSRACYLKSGPHRARGHMTPRVRHCVICQSPFGVGGRMGRKSRTEHCSRACAVKDQWAHGLMRGGSQKGHGLGRRRLRLDATERITMRDIIWTAGFYEGEGSCSGGHSTQAKIAQKDPWALERLQRWYGGSIGQWKQGRGMGIYQWLLSGSRARGFLLTIFTFLSPRRRAQVKRALA